MATYYVDPAAAGANNGSSWTDAWTNVQSAFDTAVATDVVYCRGTQTLAAPIDLDTNRGVSNTGMIKFIGMNASGVQDGTRFVLNGNSTAANCLKPNNADWYWIENFECKNATSHGVSFVTSDSARCVFVNCSFNNNGGNGWNGLTVCSGAVLVRCVAFSNTASGFNINAAGVFVLACRSRDNGGDGFTTSSSTGVFIGCIADHNSGDGFGVGGSGGTNLFFNCTADANTDDGYSNNSSSLARDLMFGCRITNHSGAGDIGFHDQDTNSIRGWNYFQNNNTNSDNSLDQIITDSSGVLTELYDQADTESGYVDQDDPEDYNLTSSATNRRVGISIPTT